MKPAVSPAMKGLAACGLLSAVLGLPTLPVHAQTVAVAPLPVELPAFERDRPLTVPKITRERLANGLQVWVVPRQGLPRVDFVLALRGAGYAADGPAHGGMATLLAGLLSEGTAQRDARAVAQAVQGLGGTLEAAAANDGIVLAANALASQAGPMLQLLAEVAREPAFADGEVELAKANALEALKAAEATPEFRADGALGKALFGAHPYGNSQPTAAAIEATTAAALRDEHRRRFRPESALLVVTGRIDPATALRMARAAFGSWRAQGEPVPPAPAAPAAAAPQRLLIDRPGSVQSTLRLGRPGAAAGSADQVALRLAGTLLGGGFSSRVNMSLREDKGYTYGAFAGARSSLRGGSVIGGADVRNEVTGAALQEFLAEYRRLGTERVPEAELNLHKRYMAGSILVANQQQAPLAQTLARNWLVGLPPEFLAQFVPRIHRVTAQQVREIGRRYFAPEAQTLVVVGDRAAVAGQLQALGEFKVLDK